MQVRPTYRPDIYVTDKKYRSVSILLTANEYAELDKKAKELNLARGTIAKDLVMDGLGVKHDD